MILGVNVKDRLDGDSNYNSWKPRVLMSLEENDILNFIEEKTPGPSDDTKKDKWRKNDIKARKILLDSIKDNLIPHISKLKTTKEMFDVLKRLFENSSTSRVLSLRQQLQNVKMTKEN